VNRIATNMTHGSGERVVLGEWAKGGAGYIGDALAKGGIYFETPEALYEALGRNRGLAWLANEQFLRNQLEAGVRRIDFVGDYQRTLNEAVGSFRWQEIRFLQETAEEYGYKLIGNSWIKSR